MQNLTPDSAEMIRSTLVNRLRFTSSHYLTTLGYVPTDKLDFKPSETARSVLEIVQHTITGAGYCLGALGLEPVGNPEATDFNELLAGLRSATDAMIAFAEAADEATFERTVEFLGMEFPMPVFLMICEWHLGRHAGQVDYIETIWGDTDDHLW